MSAWMPTAAEWSAIRLSVVVAAGAVAFGAVPAIVVAWVLARTRFIGKGVIDALIHLPLVVPPVVTGYVLLMIFAPDAMAGRLARRLLGHDLPFTRLAAVVAAAVMGFPLLVRATRLGIELVDTRIEDAAHTLGASRWRVARSVTLPLALPGIVTGLVLAFARALGEFGATITFAGNIEGETRTIPLAVFTAIQTPGGDGSALRLVVFSIVISFIALLGSELGARRVARRLGHRS